MEALDLQGLPSGGDSWTRTNDPIDVNDVHWATGQANRLLWNLTGFRDPEPQDLVFSLQTYYIVRTHW